MSVWNTLYTGSSGVRAFGDGLQVVGDNIANVSTRGFKGARANFESMLGGTAMNGQRVGNGVRMTGPQVLFGGGSIVAGDSNLNMGLEGNGFFAVRDPQTGLTSYTRDGSFGLDREGYLVGANGRVQAFGVDREGRLTPGADDLLVPPSSPGRMTTRVDMDIQLDREEDVIGVSIDPTDAATYNHSQQITVTDSTGAQHAVTLYFSTSAPGEWTWTATVDGAEVGQNAGEQVEVGNGSLSFTTSGLLDMQTGNIDVSFDGAEANQVVEFDFGDAIQDGGDGTGSTSVAHPYDARRLSHDGVSAGSLVDMRVGRDGSIIAMYDNDQEQIVASVAVATFGDQSKLHRHGNQSFLATVDSGDALLGAALTGGRGTIHGGAIEASNVDLSQELVTMIAYQRAFQSNARTVTTADEVLQEVVNLKR